MTQRVVFLFVKPTCCVLSFKLIFKDDSPVCQGFQKTFLTNKISVLMKCIITSFSNKPFICTALNAFDGLISCFAEIFLLSYNSLYGNHMHKLAWICHFWCLCQFVHKSLCKNSLRSWGSCWDWLNQEENPTILTRQLNKWATTGKRPRSSLGNSVGTPFKGSTAHLILVF